jgi:hypothetical protein
VNEGDTVELGDVSMTFTFTPDLTLSGEETLVLSPEDTDDDIRDLSLGGKGAA